MQKNVNVEAKNLLDWQLKACSILPAEFKQNQALIDDITELVVKYDNKCEQSSDDA